MKLALSILAPDVPVPVPVALLSGSFAERLEKAASLGCAGVELFVVRPSELEAGKIRSQLAEAGLEPAAVGSGAIAMVDKLTLLAQDAVASRRAVARLDELICGHCRDLAGARLPGLSVRRTPAASQPGRRRGGDGAPPAAVCRDERLKAKNDVCLE